MIAYDIYNWNHRSPRIVKIREPVGEAGTEMQQRGRGTACHSRITIRGAGRDTFKEREHGAHLCDLVQGSYKVHFRGAGVAETDIDPASR
jgi:hypothetical protein